MININKGDFIIAYATGYCEECGTNYKWKDIYSLTDFEDLEETNNKTLKSNSNFGENLESIYKLNIF